MRRDPSYAQDLIRFVGHLHAHAPRTQLARFAQESGLSPDDFSPCSPAFPGCVAAVDGSNATVVESGSFSLIAARAAESAYRNGACIRRRRSPLRLFRIAPGTVSTEYEDVYEECTGFLPETPLKSEDLSAAASVVRDMLEYWVAAQAVSSLQAGDCLLLDGSLRVSHASHEPLLLGVLGDAAKRGVGICALTKRSSLTWGGGIPLVWTVEQYARDTGVPEPWYVPVPSGIVDQQRHAQWEHGDLYLAKLHRRAHSAFKLEVPHNGVADPAAAFAACAAYAGDGRIPGYPYPLLDAHRAVAIDADVALAIRQDLISGMGHVGLSARDYLQWFGDYHDEFARY
ncbi:MAG: DNA double-strand break repair nuclease NurA [Methanomicrobiales archaeon]|nr:DNA double-strand break repair nuclease NurA [Methanomicrobiales archaeon]